jgi:SAM-dependent methyltransferase
MAMSYTATQDRVGVVRALRRFVNGLGRRCRCRICGRTFQRFSKYRGGWDAVSSYLKKLDWTGSDFDNFWCPFCRSHDRERHLFLYFDGLNFWDRFRGAEILHIAPEKHVMLAIESCAPKRYVKGDLAPSRPGVVPMNVTALKAADRSFDLVICNHVLEHVPDDRKALSELHRVLRPGGDAILQTPYAPKLQQSREHDPAVATEADCLEFYGQEDHVRLYGVDLLDRIYEADFDLRLLKHAAVLPEVDCVRAGVNPKEPFFMAHKPKYQK